FDQNKYLRITRNLLHNHQNIPAKHVEACVFAFSSSALLSQINNPLPGGPGSGKGTQCVRIVETFGFKHLSAGDLLRKELESDSIAPSEVTVKLIQKEMEASENRKFLIDGFPRSEENRKAFERTIGAEPDVVLFFDCPEEVMVERVLNRNQGRIDDNIDTVKKRLKVFEALNRPVIEYYSKKGKLHTINGVGTEDEIFEQVRPIFAGCEPPSPYTTSTFRLYAGLSRRGKKQKQLRQQQKKQLKQSRQNLVPSTTRSFPASSPTPLLINHKPLPRNKLEALEDVIDQIESTMKKRIKVDTQVFASVLETCYHLNAIDQGIRIHRLIPINLLRKNITISCKLLRLYASCGLMEEAQQVFDEMAKRDESAFPWNSLIAGYAELALYEDAMAFYFQMEEEGIEPDRHTFPRVLKACGGLGLISVGEAVHRDLVRLGYASDVFVLNALVDMYAKCGDIVKARKVFDKIECKDSVSWNSMLGAYVRHGLLPQALHTFRRMLETGVEVDSVAVSTILGNVSSLKIGAQVHGWIVRRGMEWDLSVANSLIIVYSNGGKSDKARWLFEHMPDRDRVSWNSIISAHCKDPRALNYFELMEGSGTLPDEITFLSVLSACAHLGFVKDGEKLFSLMREKYEIKPTKEHYACMVNLYGRAGLVNEAYAIIVDQMEFEAGPTVWGALLYACFLHGNVDIGDIAAKNLFELEPDNEHNFELLMKIYSNAGRLEDVERT
ncbi:Pentatricopeptide repeat-containing protein, chloroplastic, partial [Turnera subulata]